MTSIARHVTFGFMALCATFALMGCSSSDAGDTLQVSFTTGGSGMILVPETTSGVTKYSGATNVVAKVVYKGKKTLVYKWSYSLPVSAIATVDQETLTLEVSTTAGVAGTGTAVLEVYEKEGDLYEKASTSIEVVLASGG